MDIYKQLTARWGRHEVTWKPQQAKNKKGEPYKVGDVRVAGAVAYLDARQVGQRLTEVFGVGGWQTSFTPTKLTYPKKQKLFTEEGILCTLRVKINEDWVERSDVGTPSFADGLKGAHSDALKRAAVQFGIGAYLYEGGTYWIPFDGYRLNGSTPEQIEQIVQLAQKLEDWDELKSVKWASHNRGGDFFMAPRRIEELTQQEANKLIEGLRAKVTEA